ncbi:MAG: hypothetical protein HY216_10900 [Candidatus Rokubacteria bacterium]|nr:hypothetical protein [Candidatus Rokubacteria bacterium]
MKIQVLTNRDEIVAVFENAEDLDYIDYSADLDAAIRAAATQEGLRIPYWLKPRR